MQHVINNCVYSITRLNLIHGILSVKESDKMSDTLKQKKPLLLNVHKCAGVSI